MTVFSPSPCYNQTIKTATVTWVFSGESITIVNVTSRALCGRKSIWSHHVRLISLCQVLFLFFFGKLFYYILFPVLLYNWHVTLYKFKVYNIMIWYMCLLQNDHCNNLILHCRVTGKCCWTEFLNLFFPKVSEFLLHMRQTYFCPYLPLGYRQSEGDTIVQLYCITVNEQTCSHSICQNN